MKAMKRDHFLVENQVLFSSVQAEYHVYRTKYNGLEGLLLLIFKISSAFLFHL